MTQPNTQQNGLSIEILANGKVLPMVEGYVPAHAGKNYTIRSSNKRSKQNFAALPAMDQENLTKPNEYHLVNASQTVEISEDTKNGEQLSFPANMKRGQEGIIQVTFNAVVASKAQGREHGNTKTVKILSRSKSGFSPGTCEINPRPEVVLTVQYLEASTWEEKFGSRAKQLAASGSSSR